MIVIGIVGPPAGGKSTVAGILADLGAVWINADRLAHGVLRLRSVKRQLRDRFGSAIFNGAGAVRREKIADFVFGEDSTSQAHLEYIEGLVHPIAHALATRKLGRLRQRAGVVVIDAPLLIEANWHFDCDEVWYVDAPRELRIKWIANRSWGADELDRRERRQLSLDRKRHHATQIIENRGDLTATRQQILAAWQQLAARSHLFPHDD